MYKWNEWAFFIVLVATVVYFSNNSNHKEQINELEDIIEVLSFEIEDLKAKLKGLESDQSDLESRVDDIESKLIWK